MALNYVFVGFFGIAFLMALYQYFVQGVDIFSALVQRTFSDAELGAEICLGFIGVFTLWMGIMKIGGKRRSNKRIISFSSTFFQSDFPRITEKPSCFWKYCYEFQCEHVGLRQCCHTNGAESDQRTSKVKS